MLRFTEIGLFLVPFALYVVWLVLGTRTPPALVWGALGLILVMAVGTVWFGLANRTDRDEPYVPAHVEDGRIISGHAAPEPKGTPQPGLR
jgi:hypothetical protein